MTKRYFDPPSGSEILNIEQLMAQSFYRQLKVFDSKPPPTNEEIREVEELLEAKLPADYREFLRVANGGSVEFCVDVDNETFVFGDVYRAGKDDSGAHGYGTLIGEIGSARECFSTPRQVLPFAGDGGGSFVFLDLTAAGNGRVVAFVHGLPEWAGGSPEDRFVEVARSFSEYIDLHYECPDLK